MLKFPFLVFRTNIGLDHEILSKVFNIFKIINRNNITLHFITYENKITTCFFFFNVIKN